MVFIKLIAPLIIFLIIISPGIMLTYYLLGRRPLTEIFFTGSLVGLVGAIYLMRLFPLGWLPAILGAMYTFAVGLIIIRFRSGISGEKVERDDTGTAYAWVAALITYWLWRNTEMHGILPAGMSSMHHVLLVSKILLTGHTPDNWQPFETIAVNLPTGSHLFVAMTSWLWPDMAPHAAFKAAFGPVAMLTSGMIFLVGKRIYGDWRGAMLGALMWATLAKFGGIDHLKWGGLPNLMGMLLLIGIIWALASLEGMKRSLVIGWFGAGLVLVDHYGLIIAVGALSGIIITDRIFSGAFSARSREIIYGGVITIILLPVTVLNEIWKFLPGNTASTNTYTFAEFFLPIQEIHLQFGLEIIAGGILGLGFMIYSIRNSKDILVPAWAMAVIVMVAFFGYLYRAFAFGLNGEFYAAFVPSFFLMSLSYPLCVAAGYFFSEKAPHRHVRAILVAGICIVYFFIYLMPNFDFPFSNMNKIDFRMYVLYPLLFTGLTILLMLYSRNLSGRIGLIIMLAMMTSVGVSRSFDISRTIGKTIKLKEVKDFNILRTLIPSDALIVNTVSLERDNRIYGWLPYWIGVECTHTPLPSSEARLDSSVVFKRKRLAAIVQEQVMWAHLEGRPVVALVPPYINMETHGFSLLYESNFRKAYIYDPSKH